MQKFNTIEEYIKQFPIDVQNILEKIMQTITDAVPEATQTISYQMPAFKLKGKNMVYFAAWKKHIGVYPTSSGTAKFKKELSSYKFAKGSIQFPLDKPIPYGLVRQIVIFRAREISKKNSS